MKLLIVLLFLGNLLSASSEFIVETNKAAYRAYKNGNYKKAFELYKSANNPKAYYNMAQFYEHGIGVKKDNQSAMRNYEMVYYAIDLKSYKTCENELLPYFYITLKKLKKFPDY
ncbi:MAG TPA: hypothetical protein ENL00_02255, partial [Nitratifractor sp.]|nr:hypothetical protein [Nitratifractor sp.]